MNEPSGNDSSNSSNSERRRTTGEEKIELCVKKLTVNDAATCINEMKFGFGPTAMNGWSFSYWINFYDYLANYNVLLDAIKMNRTIQNVQLHFSESQLLMDDDDSKCEIIILLIETILNNISSLKMLYIHNIPLEILYGVFQKKKIYNASLTKLVFAPFYVEKRVAEEQTVTTTTMNNSTTTTAINSDENNDNKNHHCLRLQEVFDTIIHNLPSLKFFGIGGSKGLDEQKCEMLYNAIIRCNNDNIDSLQQQHRCCTIQELELSGHDIDDDACYVLANIVAVCPQLKYLALSNTRITDNGFQALVTNGLCSSKSSLNELIINCNNSNNKNQSGLITENIGTGFFGLRINAPLPLPAVAHHRQITEKGWKVLLHALKNNNIMTLETISSNCLCFFMSNTEKEIKFYLKLNKAGRRYCIRNNNNNNNNIGMSNNCRKQGDNHNNDDDDDDNNNNIENMIQSLLKVNDDLACIYYFILNYFPDICS